MMLTRSIAVAAICVSGFAIPAAAGDLGQTTSGKSFEAARVADQDLQTIRGEGVNLEPMFLLIERLERLPESIQLIQLNGGMMGHGGGQMNGGIGSKIGQINELVGELNRTVDYKVGMLNRTVDYKVGYINSKLGLLFGGNNNHVQ